MTESLPDQSTDDHADDSPSRRKAALPWMVAALVVLGGITLALGASFLCRAQPIPTATDPLTSQVQIEQPSLWPPDCSQLVPDILATFVGALLALVSALVVNHSLRQRESRERKRRSREERRRGLVDLLSELTANESAIRKIRQDIDRTGQTDRFVSLYVWSAQSGQLWRLIPDDTTRTAVAAAYDRLERTSRLLEFYISDHRGDTAAQVRAGEELERLRELTDEALQCLDTALPGISQALASLPTASAS